MFCAVPARCGRRAAPTRGLTPSRRSKCATPQGSRTDSELTPRIFPRRQRKFWGTFAVRSPGKREWLVPLGLILLGKMVLQERIELSTSPLPRECSTTELLQHLRRRRRSVAGFCHRRCGVARRRERRSVERRLLSAGFSEGHITPTSAAIVWSLRSSGASWRAHRLSEKPTFPCVASGPVI